MAMSIGQIAPEILATLSHSDDPVVCTGLDINASSPVVTVHAVKA
jgi:hypothetical protein